MIIKTYIIDAFTNESFKGNPAGVCLLENPIDVAVMQSIANELNHSETAFLQQDKNNGNHFTIRYFTPTTEIAFCGHASLASAKMILDILMRPEVFFTTHHNLKLHASKTGNDIQMKFPLYDTTPYKPDAILYKALGVSFSVETRYARELNMLLIQVADKQTLLNLQPDYALLKTTSHEIKEVVVTSRSSDVDYDFYSRCFCPWIGIDEDPVTGASHSVLAKYWGDMFDKKEMSAYQCSARGGSMKLRIIADDQLEVISNATIVLEGNITIR